MFHFVLFIVSFYFIDFISFFCCHSRRRRRLAANAPHHYAATPTAARRPPPPPAPTPPAALYDLGLASQPAATRRDDGMTLYGVRITVPVHCAPPDNRPTTTERDTCRPWLARELELLRPALRAIVALGGFAWQALLPVLTATGWQVPRPRPAFGHGAHAQLTDAQSERVLHLIGGYHPSQRNMSTRTLTPAMLRDVLQRGADIADVAVRRTGG